MKVAIAQKHEQPVIPPVFAYSGERIKKSMHFVWEFEILYVGGG